MHFSLFLIGGGGVSFVLKTGVSHIFDVFYVRLRISCLNPKLAHKANCFQKKVRGWMHEGGGPLDTQQRGRGDGNRTCG